MFFIILTSQIHTLFPIHPCFYLFSLKPNKFNICYSYTLMCVVFHQSAVDYTLKKIDCPCPSSYQLKNLLCEEQDAPFFSPGQDWSGLGSHSSYACYYNLCEFKHTDTLLCTEDCFSLQSFTNSDQYIVSVLSSLMI